MIEITGDFWEHARNYDALVCTTNCQITKFGKLVLGKGLVLDFKLKFPGVDEKFARAIKSTPYNFFCVIPWYFSPTQMKYLVAFPTKVHYRHDSKLWLIEDSLSKLVKWADESKVTKILMTRPGCGLGKLSYDDVRPLLTKYLDNRFTVIHNS